MGFTDAVKTCLRKYFDFSGRASKAEFWFFVLFTFLAGIAFSIIDSAIFGPTIEQSIEVKTMGGNTGPAEFTRTVNYSGSWLSGIFSLATLVPSLSAAWRRLHDSGKSGLWLFLPLPFFCLTFLMLFLFSEQVPIDLSHLPKDVQDQFGENPTMSRPTNPILIFGSIPFVFISAIVLIVWLTRPSTPHD
jgi:uncharacterized membrane protein YhaH (DUF805 family)